MEQNIGNPLNPTEPVELASTRPEVLPVPATQDLDAPMFAPLRQWFTDMSKAAADGAELKAKVSAQERTIAAMQTTLTDLMSERAETRVKLREAQAEVAALTTELEQTKANLTYQKDHLVATQRRLDDLATTHSALVKEHEHAADDRDLARLERDDWMDKHKHVVEEHERTIADLAKARSTWFTQEDGMSRQISTLTAERNSFRERFDQCKSLAARIMQLDRQGPEPVEQKYDA